MITESMRNLVNNGSTIRGMFEEGKRLTDLYGSDKVFDFSLGNPNVETPEKIKDIINKIINEENSISLHGYMSNAGYEGVRDKIAKNINEKYQLDINLENIIMTCGAAGGLNIILKSIIEEDDEVIVFAPFFGEYKNYVHNYKGKIIPLETDEKFIPDLEKFEKAINSKTKAVIINSPNNPTGVIYDDNIIKDIAEVLKNKEKEFDNDIYLIADEPYREIVYDDVDVPYIINYYENSFVAYSYSKSLSLPGERIGYIVISDKMSDKENTISALTIANRILGFVNAPSLFQKVISESLDLEVDVNIYKKNRDILVEHFNKIGIECEKPEGAFYLFPKSPIDDDFKFCEDAKKYNILLVPGSTFGMKGHFRLAYCVSYKTIVNSLPAFEKLMQMYK